MTHTTIHASDDLQRQAAEQMRKSVETARNLRDQQIFWQNRAQAHVKKAMKHKQYNRNYPEDEIR